MVDIPRLFREQTIDLNGHEVKLRGFRGSDYIHVDMMDEIRTKTMRLEGIKNRLTTAKDADGNILYDNITVEDENGDKIPQRIPMLRLDADLTEEELDQLHGLTNETLQLTKDFREIRSKVAQRGIKRFFYPERNTDEIDQVADIELDEIDESDIYRAMNAVSRKRREVPAEDGKGKQEKGKHSKKESKTSEK